MKTPLDKRIPTIEQIQFDPAAAQALIVALMALLKTTAPAECDENMRRRLTPFGLSPRQMDVALAIARKIGASGMSPTLIELSAELGVGKVVIFEHVQALKKKGVLTCQPKKARSLRFSPSVMKGRN